MEDAWRRHARRGTEPGRACAAGDAMTTAPGRLAHGGGPRARASCHAGSNAITMRSVPRRMERRHGADAYGGENLVGRCWWSRDGHHRRLTRNADTSLQLGVKPARRPRGAPPSRQHKPPRLERPVAYHRVPVAPAQASWCTVWSSALSKVDSAPTPVGESGSARRRRFRSEPSNSTAGLRSSN